MWCGVLSFWATRCRPGRRQLFRHYNLGPARPPRLYVKFIHKRAHQKNTTPGGAKQIFLCQRIRHGSQIKAFTFVQNVNNQFVVRQIHRQMDPFVRPFLIAIVKGIDHAFANGHPDAVAVILAKAGGFRDAQTHLLRQIDAFYLRLQRHFEVFLFVGHAPHAKLWSKSAPKPAVIRTMPEQYKSMARDGRFSVANGYIPCDSESARTREVVPAAMAVDGSPLGAIEGPIRNGLLGALAMQSRPPFPDEAVSAR